MEKELEKDTATADSPTIDGKPADLWWLQDDDCESAVGCEFGCRCKKERKDEA